MLVSVFTDDVIYRQNKAQKEYKLINGKMTGRTKCSGYCNCKQHPGYLNKKMMNEHECLEKECIWLYSLMDMAKQARQLKAQETKLRKKELNDILEYRMRKCEELLHGYEGIKITNINKSGSSGWTMKYVTICSVDKKKIESTLKPYFPGNINLIEEKHDFDTAVQIVYEAFN